MKIEPGHGGSLPAAPPAGGVGRRFAGDAAWSLVANVAAGVLALVVAGLSSRLLGVEEYGVLSLVLVATAAAHTFFLSWIPTATIRFGRAEMVRRGSIGTTLVVHTAVAVAILAAVGCGAEAAAPWFDPFLGGAGTTRAAALYLVAYFLFDHAVTLLQAGRVMRRASGLYLFERVVSVVLLGAAFLVRGGASWPAILGAIAAGRLAALALAAAWLCPVRGRPEAPAGRLREVLLWAWPLALLGGVTVLFRWGNLFILRRHGDLAEVSLLAAGLVLVNLIGVFGVSVQTALLPHLVEIFSQGGRERLAPYALRIVPWALLGASSGVTLIAAAAPLYVPFLYGETFRAAGAPTALLLLGHSLTVGNIVWDAVVSIGEDLRPKLAANVVAMATSLAVGFLLIPQWGIWGAAAGSAVAPLLQALLLRVPASRRLGASSLHDAWALVPPLGTAACLAALRDSPVLLLTAAAASSAAAAAALHRCLPPGRGDLRLLEQVGLPISRAD